MTKQQAISLAITNKMVDLAKERGTQTNRADVIIDAFNAILGVGAYEKLASDLYDDFRAAR
jgi:hypothetical protein